jgi:uncharacterized membrane protein YphA (DoxX/SURF4 family)
MNVLLWVLQALLAVAFLAHGWLFLFPPAEMVDVMNAVIPPAFRVFIGVAEVLAAVGLTLPGITRVLPWLIPLAAAGLVIVMLAATILHGMRGEVGSAITTAMLLVVATFVAYMRWKVNPILPRLPA